LASVPGPLPILEPRPVGDGGAEEAGVESALRTAVRRFTRHRLATAGLVVIVIIIVMAIAAPLIAPQGPTNLDIATINQAPSSHHLLGTDQVGRDVWARLVYGARTSLIVGFGAVAIALVIGTTLGLAAGFLGRWADQLIMRVTDAVMSVPSLLIVIVFVSITGPSLTSIVVVIALFTWTQPARLVRGQLLSLREREFVLAAHVTGVPRLRIITDHLLPNLLGPLSVLATFGVANAILTEAGLSFLGLGVRPPTASWGQMVSAAQSPEVLLGELWIWVPPSVAIALTVLSVTLIGDGLRDAVDPRSSR
jgi:peptide/nickel transport system permease protein